MYRRLDYILCHRLGIDSSVCTDSFAGCWTWPGSVFKNQADIPGHAVYLFRDDAIDPPFLLCRCAISSIHQPNRGPFVTRRTVILPRPLPAFPSPHRSIEDKRPIKPTHTTYANNQPAKPVYCDICHTALPFPFFVGTSVLAARPSDSAGYLSEVS